MQAGACHYFEWALTVLVRYQFQPKLPTGTTHHCSFCLKEHRRGKRLLLILFLALESFHLIPVTQICWLFCEHFCCFFVNSPLLQKSSSNMRFSKLDSDSRTVLNVLLPLFLFFSLLLYNSSVTHMLTFITLNQVHFLLLYFCGFLLQDFVWGFVDRFHLTLKYSLG